MDTLAPRFQALADPNRLRILLLLGQRQELCLCHLESLLDLPASTTSRHLSLLKQAGLVRARRAGRWVHFALESGEAGHWLQWLLALPELGAERARLAGLLETWLETHGGETCRT